MYVGDTAETRPKSSQCDQSCFRNIAENARSTYCLLLTDAQQWIADWRRISITSFCTPLICDQRRREGSGGVGVGAVPGGTGQRRQTGETCIKKMHVQSHNLLASARVAYLYTYKLTGEIVHAFLHVDR